jgi:MFS family permease
MSDFSATDVAFTGIRFVRERPRAVAVWAGVQIVISFVFGLVFIGLVGPYMVQLQGLNHPGQRPDPAQILPLLGHVRPIYALLLVFSLLFSSVLHATMARAVLHPGEERLGYIRFGLDEARQLLLVLLWTVIIAAAYVVILIVAIVAGLLLSATPRAFHPVSIVIACVVVAAAAVYFVVRLSLASPLTFDTRRVDLLGSWKLTRGHFWKMLGTYLLVLGLGLVILVLTSIITVAVAGVLGGLGAAASLFRPDMTSVAAFFVPARLAVSLIWALVTPLFWALFFMPVSEIYRQLRV